jgi:hypothetical protein
MPRKSAIEQQLQAAAPLVATFRCKRRRRWRPEHPMSCVGQARPDPNPVVPGILVERHVETACGAKVCRQSHLAVVRVSSNKVSVCTVRSAAQRDSLRLWASEVPESGTLFTWT